MSLILITEQPGSAAIRLLMTMVAIDGDRILTQVDVRNMYSISSYSVSR